MKLLAFLFIIASGTLAATIQTPISKMSQDQLLELAAIQGLMNTSKSYTTKIWAEQAKIDFENNQRSRPPNQQVIAAAKAQIVQITASREKAVPSHDIILRTYKLYGLKPSNYSAPIQDGKFKGDNASWAPKYHEWGVANDRMDQKGKDQTLRYHDPYGAVTWINGDIWITPDVLTESPAYLAAIILHETVHFEQFTDTFLAKTLTAIDRENRAYSEMQKSANVVALGLKSNEVAKINAIFVKAMIKLRSNPYANVPGLYEATDPEPDKLQGEKGLLEGIEEAKRAAREIQETAQENIRRRKQQADEQARAEQNSKEIAWKYIRTTVGFACSDPTGLQERAQNGQVAPAGMDVPVLSAFVERDWEKFNGCERRLLQALLSSDKPISAVWLAQEGRRYRVEHPSLFSRIFKSLGDFLSAVDEFVKSPSREDREDGGGSRDGSGSYRDNDPHRQLRGIDGGGWKAR